MNTVLVARDHLRRLRRHLLRADRLEYHAYALGRRLADDGPGQTFRVEELLPAEADDYRSHGPGHIHLSALFQIRARSRVRTINPDVVIQIHSHPFTLDGWFSSVDDRDFPEFAYDFTRDRHDRVCGRWVWGRRLSRSLIQIAPPGERGVSSLSSAVLREAAGFSLPEAPAKENSGAIVLQEKETK